MWSFVAPAPEPGTAVERPAPTFAVIIAAYQAAAYIGDAVASVLAQSRPADEVIVCDDGSTDDIEGALEPFGDAVTLLRREHRGVGAAKNAAAFATSTEFFSILDADDVFLPHYLEAVEALATERPDLDIITTNAYVEDGATVKRYYPDVTTFATGDQRRAAIHNHFIFGLATIRRSRFVASGAFDESLLRNVDTDCFVRMILDGARAGMVDEPLARNRKRAGSVSSNPVANLEGGVGILERAARHPTLTPDERAFLDGELRVKRAEVRVAAAEAALRANTRDARRRALTMALHALPPGYGTGARLKAVAAAISPRLAGRTLQRSA